MKTLGSRIAYYRSLANMSQAALATACGWASQSRIGNYEKDLREPTIGDIKTMAKALGVPVEKLLLEYEATITGIKGGIKSLKILGIAQLGPEGYWEGFDQADGYVDVPSDDDNAYALILRGDSMMPAIRSGWAAWCEPSKALVPLEYVMIKLTDGQCMIKELIKETTLDVIVQSINQDYGRMTIARSDIEHIHYVAGIVPPSKIKDTETI